LEKGVRTQWLRLERSCSEISKGGEGMLGTTLGWALVAFGVAIALVPILYAMHLAIVEEKIKHHRAAQVVAIPAGAASSCPYCGEHVSAAELMFEDYETPVSESISVAS
jgi:hypothetical protein